MTVGLAMVAAALGAGGAQAADSTDLGEARQLVVRFVDAFNARDARAFSSLIAAEATIGRNDIEGPMTLASVEIFTRGCRLRDIANAARTTLPSGRAVTAVDTHWGCPAGAPAAMRMEFDIADGRIVSAYNGAPLR